MNIGELFVKIGIKGGKESIATMNQLKTTTITTKAAIIGAVVAFAKMSQEARKLAMNLDVFEKTTGLSGDSIQKLSFRAAAAGVNLESLDGTLQSIQQRVTDISLGQGDIYPFQMWGIGLSKDPVKVLDQIAEKIKVLQQKSPAMAAKMASDFGLSNAMVYALLNEQTEELNKQFILKGKDKEALVALNREWYKLLWYVKQIAIRTQGFLAHVALPIVKATVSIVKTVGRIVIGVGELIQQAKWLQKALLIIGIAVAAVFAWLFPITAAIIGIALLIDDIYGYFTGKDSITGRMVEWIKSGEAVKAIFITIGELIREICDTLLGRKFTRAAGKALETLRGVITPGLDTTGQTTAEKLKSPQGLNFLKPSIGFPKMAEFAKPTLPGVKGGINVTQNITAQFEQRSAAEDGERVGELTNQCSWAAYQQAEAAHG